MLFTIFFSMVVASISCIVLVLVFVYTVRTGQYDDIEAPKYRIMTDDDANPIEQDIENKVINQDNSMHEQVKPFNYNDSKNLDNSGNDNIK